MEGTYLENLTFGTFIRAKAEKNGDKLFLHSLADDRRFSYADVDALTDRIANGLIGAGIVHGSHVAVMMDNCPEQIFAYFALAKIGAVAVPINTAARGRFLEYYLEHSDSVALIAETGYLARFCEVEEALTRIGTLIEVPSTDQPGETATPRRVRHLQFDDLLVSDVGRPASEVAFSDLAMLSYTSGTTGPSKANMMVQATHLKAAFAGARANGYLPDDVIYICLPTNHTNGLWSMLQAMVADASVALSRRFSTSRYWDEVRRVGATYTNILGTMVSWLWNAPEREDDSSNSLRTCHIVPMPPFTRDFERRFGVKVITGYGLTDFCTAAGLRADDESGKIGSAGQARPHVQIRIADDYDRELPCGAVGEILLRTDDPWSIAQGYYKMPEATVAANRNQWFHTGDRGYLDAEGYLFFSDRKKDSMRRRGENISAFEVETIIAGHPAVAEVAVFAVDASTLEDEVAATVVLKDNRSLSESELVAFCAANMAHYMVPRFIAFLGELPKTPSQKVEKYRLRADAQANLQAMWDREREEVPLKR